jgi:hypothetical protein
MNELRSLIELNSFTTLVRAERLSRLVHLRCLWRQANPMSLRMFEILPTRIKISPKPHGRPPYVYQRSSVKSMPMMANGPMWCNSWIYICPFNFVHAPVHQRTPKMSDPSAGLRWKDQIWAKRNRHVSNHWTVIITK